MQKCGWGFKIHLVLSCLPVKVEGERFQYDVSYKKRKGKKRGKERKGRAYNLRNVYKHLYCHVYFSYIIYKLWNPIILNLSEEKLLGEEQNRFSHSYLSVTNHSEEDIFNCCWSYYLVESWDCGKNLTQLWNCKIHLAECLNAEAVLHFSTLAPMKMSVRKTY